MANDNVRELDPGRDPRVAELTRAIEDFVHQEAGGRGIAVETVAGVLERIKLRILGFSEVE